MIPSVFSILPPLKLIALATYGEARGEGLLGMMAVANVIRNRTKNPNAFADSDILIGTGSMYHAVILKPYQFSCFNSNDPQRANMEYIAENFDQVLPNDEYLRKAYSLAKMVGMNTISDNTLGATHYYSPVMISPPQWAGYIPYLIRIGNHLFFGDPSDAYTNPPTITETPPNNGDSSSGSGGGGWFNSGGGGGGIGTGILLGVGGLFIVLLLLKKKG